MFSKNLLSRRNFFILAGATGAGLVDGCTRAKSDRPAENGPTAIEVLERQHGVTRRALAILEKIKDEIDALKDIAPEIAAGTVRVIGTFMINCHQLMEEKFVFPLFEASPNTAGLIAELRRQHAAAFKLTDILKPLCLDFSQKDQEKRQKTATMLHLLTRMSRAHTSWEDTALFPLLRSTVSSESYDRLSSDFRKAEAEFLGRDSLTETMTKIAGYENSLGIGNLASFTPQPEDLS